jgi:hypothetical protein
LFAAESLIPDRPTQQVFVYVTLGGSVLFLALLRLAIYIGSYAPPMTVWGRIRTLRPIIPGYDQVLLAPICVLLIGLLAFDRFRPPGLDDLVFLPIAEAVATAVALTTGPSLERWRLTGQHRIRQPGAGKAAEFVKVG